MKKGSVLLLLLSIVTVLAGCKKKETAIPKSVVDESCQMNTFHAQYSDAWTFEFTYNTDGSFQKFDCFDSTNAFVSRGYYYFYDNTGNMIEKIDYLDSIGYRFNYFSDGKVKEKIVYDLHPNSFFYDSSVFSYPVSSQINILTYSVYMNSNFVQYKDTIATKLELDQRGNTLKEYMSQYRNASYSSPNFQHPANRDTLLLHYEYEYVGNIPKPASLKYFPPLGEWATSGVENEFFYSNDMPSKIINYKHDFNGTNDVQTIFQQATGITYEMDGKGNVLKISSTEIELNGNYNNIYNYTYRCN